MYNAHIFIVFNRITSLKSQGCRRDFMIPFIWKYVKENG